MGKFVVISLLLEKPREISTSLDGTSFNIVEQKYGGRNDAFETLWRG